MQNELDKLGDSPHLILNAQQLSSFGGEGAKEADSVDLKVCDAVVWGVEGSQRCLFACGLPRDLSDYIREKCQQKEVKAE